MKIALFGYGKMGKAIEKAAIERGHEIVYIADNENEINIEALEASKAEAIIEFTLPAAVIKNLQILLPTQIPVVCGTTGWLSHLAEIQTLTEKSNASFIYSSNFSIGVNILFKMNQTLAKLMNPHPQYDCFIEEQHHRHKADAPSGTALSLAKGILEDLERKTEIATDALLHRKPTPEELSIGYIRGGEIIGRHKVSYSSDTDTITIEHNAHNRNGFAIGAVVAAEWILGKKGVYNFIDIF
jgi:4-hydroxy-tetrahydrodipicolinate reductase